MAGRLGCVTVLFLSRHALTGRAGNRTVQGRRCSGGQRPALLAAGGDPPHGESPDALWSSQAASPTTTRRRSQIISHLTPGSLVAVSRTSRFLRSLTCTKRAEPVWTAARQRRGWPDLEAGGLNEVEYAKLVEGEFCCVSLGPYSFSLDVLTLHDSFAAKQSVARKGMTAIVATRSGETFAFVPCSAATARPSEFRQDLLNTCAPLTLDTSQSQAQ